MQLNFSPENCGYRGEGNTGLVIYLKKEEKVLRLIKQDVSSEHETHLRARGHGRWPTSPTPSSAIDSQNQHSYNQSSVHTQSSSSSPASPFDKEFIHALDYVKKVEIRFQDQRDIYIQFLEIMRTYQEQQKNIKDGVHNTVRPWTEHEVYAQICKLFQNQEDLVQEFRLFLSDKNLDADLILAKLFNIEHNTVVKKPTLPVKPSTRNETKQIKAVKRPAPSTPSPPKKDSISFEVQLKDLKNQVSMVENVMIPLLGENLVNSPKIVFINYENIKMLNNLFASYRPKFRTHKHVKEEDSHALMLPDYCTLPPDLKVFSSSGPVISVEIKPKQGYFSTEEFLPPDVSSRSRLVCRFCMTQHYKMKRNLISSRSTYCPTDLFSGCPTRMKYALKLLLQTPQNNLRIFKDQDLIYSEEKKSDLDEELSDFFVDDKFCCPDVLCDLIIKVLLKSFSQKIEETVRLFQAESLQTCPNASSSCTEDGVCHTLPVGCVLYRILCIQMLDQLHIRNLYPFFLKVKQTEDTSADHIGCFPVSEIPPHFGEVHQMENESDYEYASRKVWEFLVALTVRDCSIMLVLKNYTGRIPSSRKTRSGRKFGHNVDQIPNLVLDEAGQSYLFSVAIADLDAKPLNKVEKHYKETPLLVQSCI